MTLCYARNLGVDWTFFWEAARNEMWGRQLICKISHVHSDATCRLIESKLSYFFSRNHYVVQEFSDECRKKAVPLGLHGDEGQGKKERSMFILSWHALGVRAKSVVYRKFPICVS